MVAAGGCIASVERRRFPLVGLVGRFLPIVLRTPLFGAYYTIGGPGGLARLAGPAGHCKACTAQAFRSVLQASMAVLEDCQKLEPRLRSTGKSRLSSNQRALQRFLRDFPLPVWHASTAGAIPPPNLGTHRTFPLVRSFQTCCAAL